MAELISTPLFSDSALKAYYRFNTGALTTDSKGSNTLTNNNTVGETASGKFGYAADYGASNSNKFFDINSGLSMDLGGAYSVSIWIKWRTEVTSGGTEQFIFQHFSTTTSDRALGMLYRNPSGTPMIRIDPAGSTIDYNFTFGTVNWHHIVYTCSAAGAVTLYINGVVATTGSRGSSPGGVNHVWLGCNQGGSNFASFYQDDLGIFSKELTAAEVLTLYKETSNMFLLF